MKVLILNGHRLGENKVLKICTNLALFATVVMTSGCSWFGGHKDSSTGSILRPIPSGYCTLDPAKQAESKILYNIQKQFASPGKLRVTIFLPCDELEAVRSNKSKNVSHYGMFLEPEK